MDIFSEEEKSFRAIFYYFWTLETDDNEDNRQTTIAHSVGEGYMGQKKYTQAHLRRP